MTYGLTPYGSTCYGKPKPAPASTDDTTITTIDEENE